MSDLRTRIAGLLRDDIRGYARRLEVADAVIRELGLREQTGNDAAHPQVIPCAEYLRTHHRYVTHWIPDTPTR